MISSPQAPLPTRARGGVVYDKRKKKSADGAIWASAIVTNWWLESHVLSD